MAHSNRVVTAVAATLAMLASATTGAQTVAAAVAHANDNTRPAGVLENGVLTVNLVAGEGLWQPEGPSSPKLRLAAFAEEGRDLEVPGPLLRVAEGTRISVRVKNTLPGVLQVHGLVDHPAPTDRILEVPEGETRDVTFDAGKAGTYHYWATLSGARINTRPGFEGHLGGAFVVDPVGTPPADRVFVLGLWNRRTAPRLEDERVAPEDHTFTLNGLSWPHTERIAASVGDRVRWRIVNLTPAPHPMHLHGFYFDVTGEGTGLQHDKWAEVNYRHVVTHVMTAGTTLDMAWTPERAGNWLFHCHVVGHVAPLLRFWEKSEGHGHHDGNHASTGMAGLVMGISVDGEAAAPAPRRAAETRQLTLTMQKRAGYWKPEDAFGFALKTGAGDPTPAAITVPGPTLVLARNEPVAITLENLLPEATSIHWHGIELDSYYDGVAGFSGTSASTTPLIAPGESMVVRFTPPRAGTFIYHTHSHDNRQLASGLYGALIVVAPGETFDPARDHIVLLGNEGPRDPATADRLPVVVNGTRKAAVALKRGAANRIRIINISQNFSGLNVSLIHANQPLEWLPVAKDGADLPSGQQTGRTALRQPISVGETYDFIVQPPPAGPMWIEVRRANGEWVQQVPVTQAP